MKITVLILMTILVLSCNQNLKTSKVENFEIKTENFDWLIGNWKRLNEEPGKETFENWTKINDNKYSGIGFTMQNGDTIKQEKIHLIKTEGKWSLTVKVPEEKESITFTMSEQGNNIFTCINDSIDFPNKIKYWNENGKLKAKVSNDEMEIPFEFKKLN